MSPAVIRVQVASVGEVRVRPDNIAGTWRPMLWWTLTSRRWSPWLPVNVVVIQHPRGTVLFDTGQDPASVSDPSYYPPGLLGWVYRRQAAFRSPVGQSLEGALAAAGVPLSEVDTVVLSHLHQDHAGNVAALPEAEILVDATELALLDERSPELHGVLPRHLDRTRLTPVRHASLRGDDLAPFTEGHDLFDDGTLVLLPTPGHSAGSMSLLVRREAVPPLLLVGDVTYDPALLRAGRVPGTGARSLQEETSARINALRQRLPELVVVAAHDPGAASVVAGAVGEDGAHDPDGNG
ncbi:N-acyl homoserine lactonase family protein [Nocardioides sp.]|uniref:N-acyl homoserine lactonase family protein n=1 Tax=Nocardioides sp. TaxID=35761 RepID=UPI00260A5E29|nr:N-acyl homoserine lactonase family protein [Nocardioides sp.]